MTTGQFSRVFLTGLSGSGKSTVAKLVADALGWDCIDTDALIESAAGRSVAEIFAGDGEEQFRVLERK
ncbi:MAG: dephospho-CoA kinase, partial [Chloroflexi bacterium]|nr:dephospho-CoA kinase [Chloroflexota bacterium]